MENDYNKRLGQRLKHYRELTGVTQTEMGEMTGHTKNYISALEHGSNKMSVPTLLAYSKKLKVSLDELTGLKEEDNIIPELRELLTGMTVGEQKRALRLLKALEDKEDE